MMIRSILRHGSISKDEANAFRNGRLLYKDCPAHFYGDGAIPRSGHTRGSLSRQPGAARGETDPAGMEVDLWVRSKETHNHSFPPFETFLHFY